MSTVNLSDHGKALAKDSFSQQRLARNQRQSAREKNLTKEIVLLTQAIRIRDDEILRLKNVIISLKQQKKHHKTAITESDCDSAQYCDVKHPLTATIENYREQLESLKNKYSQSCDIISQLQSKLKAAMSSAKNKETQMRNEIEILREDLKYLKEEHERSTDCLKIQFEHRQTERLKIADNTFKQQLELLNEEIRNLKHDCSEKGLEIIRLNDKIKKERANNESNVRFLENQNAEMRKNMDIYSQQIKEEVKKRQQGLIQQFRSDLEALHKEQAGQIRLLCERIRVLKVQLDDKDCQLKQLWKARGQQAEMLYSTRGQINKLIKAKDKDVTELSTIDKYLKH